MNYLAKGHGRSFRAHKAQQECRFPATKIANILGVSSVFIKKYAPFNGEWHHTGVFGRKTEFYDLEAVRNYINSPKGKADYNEWVKQRKNEIKYENCEVWWINWVKQSYEKYARPQNCYVKSATIVDGGGEFVTVDIPVGNMLRDGDQVATPALKFRKKKDTKGFKWKRPIANLGEILDAIQKYGK